MKLDVVEHQDDRLTLALDISDEIGSDVIHGFGFMKPCSGGLDILREPVSSDTQGWYMGKGKKIDRLIVTFQVIFKE